MTDTLTPTIRLTEPTPGGDSGTWATLLNSDMAYIDEAINQSVTVSIADVNVVLIADGTSSDQARYLRYNFTGALTADRTVTLPTNVKVGYASNNTTGGHKVILKTGAGATISLADGSWTFFNCDGVNLVTQTVTFGGLRLSTAADIWFTGPVSQAIPISANSVGMGYASATQTLSIYSGTCPLNLAGTFNTQPVTQYFFNQTQVGSVNVTPTTTAYNTTSDARLKLDDGLIERLEAGRIVDRLRPRWFRFKSAPDADKQPGFFAQQVHRVFPWAVTKGRKGQPWQMDAAKLLPVVIAELQSLRRRLAALEAPL